MTVETFLVYSLTGIFCFILAKNAVNSNDKKKVLLIVLILSMVSGLRAYSVGIDTQSYVRIFENIVNGQFIYAYGVEESFKYLCYGLSFVCKHPTWFFLVLSLITNGFIVFRLWECRNFSEFKYSFSCYYFIFFFMTMNICRQFAAIAIVFWATRFLFARRYLKFIIIVLFSGLIHTSSLVGILFIVFEVFNWKYLNAKQKQFIVFILTLIPIGIFVLFEGINQYSDLLVVSNNSIGIMLFIKLLIYIFSLLIVKQLLIKDTNLKEMMEIKYRSRAAALYYFCGIILTFLGYFFSYVDRIGLVFYLFEGVHIGKTIKFANNPVNRRFFIFLEMLILLFYYVKLLLEGAQGVVPYFFVWQA